MGNKFGWHSGTLKAKNVEVINDLKISNDLVFSDVSAGTLGVTGGIDMTGTTQAIGIDMSGGTFSTAAIRTGGKIDMSGASSGAASASGLLLGTGTTASPATTATADAKFIELRCQSTATSGDNRLMYLRYEINGATGGESLRAFTKITAANTTSRGTHISLDMGDTGGTISGLGVGVDAQLLMGNTAYTTGTWAAINSEIYSDGASTDISGLGAISFLRCEAGGNATGIGNVNSNAYFVEFAGVTEGSGKMIDTDKTTFTAVGGIKIKTDQGDRWIAVISA